MDELLKRVLADLGKSEADFEQEVAELKSQLPPTQEELASLKSRQDETENTILFLLDMTLGGM